MGSFFGYGDVRKMVDQSQDEQHGRVAAHRHAGLTLFNLEERHAADGRTLGSELDRDAPSPPRVADVTPQLA